ncbi:hypothetical protein EGW08_012310, partial [Elysia chlorotica]
MILKARLLSKHLKLGVVFLSLLSMLMFSTDLGYANLPVAENIIGNIGNLYGNGSNTSFSNCHGSGRGGNCSIWCHCADELELEDCSNEGCPSGCMPGWMGVSCDKLCPAGSWGTNCSLLCSSSCQNQTCHPADGYCICAYGAPVFGCDP